MKGLGTNLLFISPGSTTQSGRPRPGRHRRHVDRRGRRGHPRLRAVSQGVAVAPEAPNGGQVVANGQNTFTRLNGVTPDFLDVRNFRVAEGDFFSHRAECPPRSLVAVLGANTRQTLFGDSDAIGQTVRVNQHQPPRHRRHGRQGAQAQGNQDDIIYVPLTTMQTRLNRNRTARGGQTVSTINVQLADDREETRRVAVENIAERAARAPPRQPGRLHHPQPGRPAPDGQPDHRLHHRLPRRSVAGISLLVGGIGIMNIMLVTRHRAHARDRHPQGHRRASAETSWPSS
ncbi:MAG: ABC transporter permease [Hymenobacter sp.]